MTAARRIVETYIRAKDENCPYLMGSAFAEDAVLEIISKASALSFPPFSYGLDSITDVLVRRFTQSNENVHTFCLASPPTDHRHVEFSCPWLVGMSDKETRALRVGCGRYAWRFRSGGTCVAERLSITIDIMETLPCAYLAAVMKWMSSLPRPWCPARLALEHVPPLRELGPIREYVSDTTA
jgi:hypothetical protein